MKFSVNITPPTRTNSKLLIKITTILTYSYEVPQIMTKSSDSTA